MTILVTVETCLLVVIGLLVAGLLRSHAEIVKALNLDPDRDVTEPMPAAGVYAPNRPIENPTMGRAEDLRGVTPTLAPVVVPVAAAGRGTLVAFLSSGCLTCYEFWDALADDRVHTLPEGARAAIVTKGPDDESVAKVRDLAPPDVPVVMSTETWDAYGVPGAPYFAWVEAASGTVEGVGAATQWASVLRLLEDSLAETDTADAAASADSDEATLIAAGIYPGDPTLDQPLPVANGGTQ
ncbi:MAG: hypothetical protein QOD08_1720 [Gaiellaceae bacterium]|jgi:hypothetical protein|nr:hypothetical protein [Gaiellaceae bacterium]